MQILTEIDKEMYRKRNGTSSKNIEKDMHKKCMGKFRGKIHKEMHRKCISNSTMKSIRTCIEHA